MNESHQSDDGFQKKLIFVIGATGTGKSEVGIQIAKSFTKSEIISADSMQVYKKLSIGTAKVTPEESEAVKHHMIDICDPNTECFNMTRFVAESHQKILELWGNRIVPLVVGGTILYSVSLLNKLLGFGMSGDDCHVSEDAKEDQKKKKGCEDRKNTVEAFLRDLDSSKFSESERKFKVLEKIDYDHSLCLRVNDVFRVNRSVEAWILSGLSHASRSAVQISDEKPAIPLENLGEIVSIVWVDCLSEVLQERLNRRVDQMVQKGLFSEIVWIADQMRSNRHRNSSDNKEKFQGVLEDGFGAMQSIGYREFIPIINILCAIEDETEYTSVCKDLMEGFPNLKESRQIVETCLDRLKSNSRAYARKQRCQVVSWFVNNLNFHSVPLYKLNSCDLTQWPIVKTKMINYLLSTCSPIKGEGRSTIAVDIESKNEMNVTLLQITTCGEEHLMRIHTKKQPLYALSNSCNKHQKFFCNKCGTSHRGIQEYDAHLSSKLHKKGGGRHRNPSSMPDADAIVL